MLVDGQTVPAAMPEDDKIFVNGKFFVKDALTSLDEKDGANEEEGAKEGAEK
ncbi:hypothetical protein A2U01_0060969, partial [Trifolium medium]|nr:hypothetical protein [Trifolium medium]